jgi:death-on-curing protein
MSIDLPLDWISVAELESYHTRVIAETGGSSGILNPDGLKNAVDSPLSTFGGQDLYPSLLHKTAQLIRAINNHVFVDGNKRTSLVAADVILRRNGFRLVETVDLEYFFLEVADKGKPIEEIVDFLRRHVVKYVPS